MTTAADTRTEGRKRRSITAQPWFPAFVGIWFAALFGLCSLMLPAPLLERVVSTLGLDRVFPAVAPPLGETARILLVLGFSGVGEILGLVIGRRLAKEPRSEIRNEEPAPRRARDEHPDAPARKPLSAVDDLRGFDEELPADPDDEDVIEQDWTDDEWCAEPAIEPVSPVPEHPRPVAGMAPEPRIVQTRPRSAVATASLDSLGVVQLSERLALAIAARRERQSEGDETLSPASAGDWAEPRAAERNPHDAPAIVETPWSDVLMQRPRRKAPSVMGVEPAEPVESEFASDHDDIEDETADAPYSSLLDMGPSHLRHAPVDVDEDEADAIEPVADIFRDAEPSVPSAPAAEADPAETDRALKAALESLQRISGAR